MDGKKPQANAKDKTRERKREKRAPREADRGRGAPERGSLHALRGSGTLATTPSPDTNAPDASDPEMGLPMVDLLPTLGGVAITNRFRTPSAKDAGRGPDGRVIPHTRSEEIAQVVATMAAGGADINTIAVYLDIRPGHLRACYKNELEHSHAIANAKVAATALQMATSGENDTMTKFWLERRAGWEKKEEKEGTFLNIHLHS